ncbi:hypothetical protein M9H77_25058 [Catharanthus roseus]|uniref:Uncharacterized protein n=1 Tax=Catharanthus roseus TaxID=4058 RepID=A0ACC0A786_CATRO|nr:hypothetical protein M9H77_25058 [Catharanthus roseus]
MPKKKKLVGPSNTKEPVMGLRVKLYRTNQNKIFQRSPLYLCLKTTGIPVRGSLCIKWMQEGTRGHRGKHKKGAQNQSAGTASVECPKESSQTVVEKGRSNKNGKSQASSSGLKQGIAMNEPHKKDMASVTQNHPPDGQDPGAAKEKEGNKVGSKEAQGNSTKNKEQGRQPTQNPTIGLATTKVNTNKEDEELFQKKSSQGHVVTKRLGKDMEEEQLETTPATDINLTGTFFTWTNNQTWSKIDRAMCKQVWFSEGLYATARFLPSSFISDHLHRHKKLLARSFANLGYGLITIRDVLVEKEGSTLQAANRVVSYVSDDTLNTSLAYDYFKGAGSRQIWARIDRLLFLDIDRSCNVCSRQEENLSHLFFGCPFTADIWKSIKEWTGLRRDMSTISSRLKWLLNESRGTSWKCTWRKLCFAATLYYGHSKCIIRIPINV